MKLLGFNRRTKNPSALFNGRFQGTNGSHAGRMDQVAGYFSDFHGANLSLIGGKIKNLRGVGKFLRGNWRFDGGKGLLSWRCTMDSPVGGQTWPQNGIFYNPSTLIHPRRRCPSANQKIVHRFFRPLATAD